MSRAGVTRTGTGRRVTARPTASATGQASRAASPGTATKKAGEVVGKGENWTARRGPGRGPEAYPVQVCSVRFKDPATGQWAPKPKNAPAPGTARKGRSGAALTLRTRNDEGDVVGARVVLGAFRRGQKRGQVSKATVQAAEREASRDALAEIVGRQEAERYSAEMGAAYRSDKAKRGAATRAKNKAAGRGPRRRPADAVRLELLRTEELVKDARRRHDGAKSYTTKQKHAETLKKRQHKAATLRRELDQVGG